MTGGVSCCALQMMMSSPGLPAPLSLHHLPMSKGSLEDDKSREMIAIRKWSELGRTPYSRSPWYKEWWCVDCCAEEASFVDWRVPGGLVPVSSSDETGRYR